MMSHGKTQQVLYSLKAAWGFYTRSFPGTSLRVLLDVINGYVMLSKPLEVRVPITELPTFIEKKSKQTE